MKQESALVLLIPEADRAVGQIRTLHDPVALLGMPAHVTLLYPFAAPPITPHIADALRTLFGGVAAFDLVFDKTGRFTETLYIAPQDEQPVRDAVRRVVQRWPHYRPYGGRFAEIVPHLTVADRQPQRRVLDDLEMSLVSRLPIRANVRAAHLFVSNEDGRWHCEQSYPLAVNRRETGVAKHERS